MSGLPVLFLVPFNGILVRHRASYRPKTAPAGPRVDILGLRVDDNGVEASEIPKPTFLGIVERVYSKEGFEGFFKGLMPTLLFCVAWPAFWPWELPFKAYLSPSPPINLLYPFVYIFAIVITYRAITTKHKLESFKAEEALRVLLTTHERNSWRAIYAIPGLLPALFLEVVLRWLFLQLGHQLLQPFDLGPRYPSRKAQYETTELSIGICLAVASFATVFLAPLEVIVTRLAIQRNYGPALKPKPAEASIKPSQTEVVDLEKGVVAGEKASVVFDATEEKNESSKVREVAAEARVSEKDVPVSPTTGVDPETADTDADLEPATNIEPGDSAVIRLRNENEQYTGLINCAKTIIKDEGWKPLYRMCFVTFCGIMTTLVQL